MLNRCRNKVTNTDPELKQQRVSIYIVQGIFQEPETPNNMNKRRSNVGPASAKPGQPKNATRSTASARRGGVISRHTCDISAQTEQTRGADPTLRQCCADVEDAVPTLPQHWTKTTRSLGSDTCDTIARLTAIVSHAQHKSTKHTHL